MKLRFDLKGQCKSGKNNMQMTRTGHKYPLKAFADWRDEQVAAVTNEIVETVMPSKWLNRKPWEAISVPMKATVVFTHADKRRRDVPGMLDALWHVFERAGVVKDDSLIIACDVDTRPITDKENAGVWIELTTDWIRQS